MKFIVASALAAVVAGQRMKKASCWVPGGYRVNLRLYADDACTLDIGEPYRLLERNAAEAFSWGLSNYDGTCIRVDDVYVMAECDDKALYVGYYTS